MVIRGSTAIDFTYCSVMWQSATIQNVTAHIQ